MATTSVVAGHDSPRPGENHGEHSTLNVGTRKSNLAMAQTHLVVKALASECPENNYAIKARDTAAGDIDKVTAFKDMPVKNLWTHELETLMIEGSLDFLVHSLKGKPFFHLCAINAHFVRRCSYSTTTKLRDRRCIAQRGSARCFCPQGRPESVCDGRFTCGGCHWHVFHQAYCSDCSQVSTLDSREL